MKADTKEEAMTNIKEAIALYLEPVPRIGMNSGKMEDPARILSEYMAQPHRISADSIILPWRSINLCVIQGRISSSWCVT